MTDIHPDARALLALRYGAQPKPRHILWNDHIAALLRHRSVRDYLPDPLPEGAIETMVAAAQSASTSSNLHQWSVVAVADPELKARVADLASGRNKGANQFIHQAPTVLLWVADLSRSNAITRARGGTAEVHEYLDSFLMAGIDAALAAQNAAVAAEATGLGVVYIGAMRNEAKQLAELVDLPEYSFVAFGMAVGKPAAHASKDEQVRPRPPQQVVLHHNRYDSARSMQGLDMYEAEFARCRERSGTRPRTWRDSVVHASEMAYMDGRENLRQAVGDRGFRLR